MTTTGSARNGVPEFEGGNSNEKLANNAGGEAGALQVSSVVDSIEARERELRLAAGLPPEFDGVTYPLGWLEELAPRKLAQSAAQPLVLSRSFEEASQPGPRNWLVPVVAAFAVVFLLGFCCGAALAR